jgi:hypothetical protein
MHPTVSCELMQAQIADLHRQAQRDALAHAARRARRPPRQQPGPPGPSLPAIRRRVLTVLGARSA